MQKIITLILRCARTVPSETVCGLTVGAGLTLAAQSWLALFGLDLAASLVVVFALSAGVCSAIILSPGCSATVYPAWSRWLTLTAWMGLMPLWVTLAEFGPARIPVALLESVPLQMLALLPGAAALIGFPSFLITLVTWKSTANQIRPRILWSLWTGGFVCAAVLLPLFDSQILLWSCVALSLVAAGWSAWQTDNGRRDSLSSKVFSTRHPRQSQRPLSLSHAFVLWSFPAVAGCLMAAAALIVRPWCPISLPVLMGQLFSGVLGFLLALRLSGAHRIGRAVRGIPVVCWLLIPILIAHGLILFEPAATRLLLALSTQWSSPVWLLLARTLSVSLFPFLLGVSTGVWCRHVPQTPRVNSSTFWTVSICLAAISWGTAECLFSAGYQAQSLLIVITVATLIGGALSFTPDRGRSRVTATWGYRLSRLAVTSAMGLLLLLSVSLPEYPGLLPARVLFSPLAASQFQAGLEWRLVPHVDDARLTDQVSSSKGVLTAFNYHGLETTLRRDGLPVGYLSHDYRVMPQFPADGLMIVLPSVLHGEIETLAISHWNCGVTVSNALEFPIEHIDCFDAQEPAVRVTYGRHEQNPWAGLNPLTDTRVRLRTVSPAIGLRSQDSSYDVIVSDPPRSILAEAADEMTIEFYRTASARLNSGGVFCQRFLHYDHGPESWADVLATLRSVFPQVAAIEMVPGETLFVASATRDLSTLPDLAERLQKPQVRRVLARFGWDWGHVLRLPTVHAAKCDELLSQVNGDIQSACNPSLCYSHVTDAMRWADKWDEKTSALSPFRGRFATIAGENAASGEIQRRMEEVVAQQSTMSEEVDLPWVYRRKLKEFLSLKPRSEIVQVKGARPRQEMHPVDKRRVDYLKALAEAHNAGHPTAAAIDHMTQFTTPFDPLISYFLHYEAAELYARLPDSDPQAEFHHRLKTIYFGDVRDKSVRNVIAALNLLLEHDDLAETPQERFDQIHGLMQFLLNRWQLRTNYSPRNTDEALVDVRESLSVAERGLETLDRLAAETGFDEAEWSARREYLELFLMTPLRSYRGRLLPHHERTLRRRTKQQ